MTIDRVFLEFSARKLRQHFATIETWVAKLPEERIWSRDGDQANAIGNLLLHLAGNVRQWIVSGAGGRPDIRVRDLEFSTRGGVPKEELLNNLRAVVEEAIPVIESVSAERLLERIVVQKYDVTVLEAIAHVIEHFALHTGQIVFAAKGQPTS